MAPTKKRRNTDFHSSRPILRLGRSGLTRARTLISSESLSLFRCGTTLFPFLDWLPLTRCRDLQPGQTFVQFLYSFYGRHEDEVHEGAKRANRRPYRAFRYWTRSALPEGADLGNHFCLESRKEHLSLLYTPYRIAVARS